MQYIGTILEMIITLFKGTLKGEKKAKMLWVRTLWSLKLALQKTSFLFPWQFFCLWAKIWVVVDF